MPAPRPRTRLLATRSAPAETQGTDPVQAEPNPYLVLITVSICTMLYSMTVTIVNVVLPQLQGALSATPDQVSWIVTLNVVGTAVVTPMTIAVTPSMDAAARSGMAMVSAVPRRRRIRKPVGAIQCRSVCRQPHPVKGCSSLDIGRL